MSGLHKSIISADVLRRSLFVNAGLGTLKLLVRNDVAATVILQLVGVAGDILFVQKYFSVGDKPFVPVPYADLRSRANSFADKVLMSKAIVVIALSYIVTDILTDEALRIARSMRFFKNLREDRVGYLDMAITVGTNAIAGWLFLNLLKFRWAYVHNTDINTTFLVLAWFSLTTIMYTMRNTLRDLRRRQCSRQTATT